MCMECMYLHWDTMSDQDCITILITMNSIPNPIIRSRFVPVFLQFVWNDKEYDFANFRSPLSYDCQRILDLYVNDTIIYMYTNNIKYVFYLIYSAGTYASSSNCLISVHIQCNSIATGWKQ